MRFLIPLVMALSITPMASAKDIQTAILAGGCFWCVESDLESVQGVVDVKSGFAGGSESTANYKTIKAGKTKHREAVKVTYDADKISYEKLVDIFFRSIDPHDANGSFCDRGKTYAAAIYATESQKATAGKVKARLQKTLPKKIVTPILPSAAFFPASKGHQDYYKSNSKVVTRFGVLTKAKAYKKYRVSCGRDAKISQIWGDRAPFADKY